jgi:hypothetical protein
MFKSLKLSMHAAVTAANRQRQVERKEEFHIFKQLL